MINPKEIKISFSLITPVFNGGTYLEQLIQSIQKNINGAAEFAEIEHLIIDDGSDDGGATVRILNQYPHLRWWSRENRGQYPTMNEGLQAAKGDWVSFISADDMLTPGTLIAVSQELLKNPQIDGVWGRSRSIYGDGRRHEVQPLFQRMLSAYKYFSQIPHSAVFFRKSFLLSNQLLFDDTLRFNGDYDWFLRVLNQRPDLKFLNECFVDIRRHSAQATQAHFESILIERTPVHEKYRVSPFIYNSIRVVLGWYYAIARIKYQIRENGISAGFALLAYFIRNRFSKK